MYNQQMIAVRRTAVNGNRGDVGSCEVAPLCHTISLSYNLVTMSKLGVERLDNSK